MRLQGQIVWITGSARRVGRVIALHCAREGADIVVHYQSSRAEAMSAAAEIRELGRRAIVVQGDHADATAVAGMVEQIQHAFGGLTALVNCAAGFPAKPFEQITEQEFFDILRVNTWGPFLCSQAALPMLRRANPGRIVNITDWAVARPYRGHAHYMASKGALSTLTRAMARELAPGVLVNAVAPGPVLEPPDLDPDQRDRILDRIPVGRWGTPESVAAAVVMLLENDNICGQEIVVDGGRSFG